MAGVETESPRKRPSYNVRIQPPKARFGWLGGFLYRVKKNRELNIARLYAVGGIAGITILFIGLRKFALYEREQVRLKSEAEANGEDDETLKGPKDYIVRGTPGKGPEIKISEKDNMIEVAFYEPIFGMYTTLTNRLDYIQFDEEGNIVLDDHGFPLYKGQRPIGGIWRDGFRYIKLKIDSLQLFKKPASAASPVADSPDEN